MIIVSVETKNIRGFLKELFNYSFSNISFLYEERKTYEKASKLKVLAHKLGKSWLFDFLGFFQIINVGDKKCDVCVSYNRFLNSNKPYIIILENPSALVNYSWKRLNKYMTKKRLERCFKDENLKAIVCLSNACKDTIRQFYNIPERIKIERIYPLIPEDYSISEDKIARKADEKVINCLFVSSQFELKGGRDIITAWSKVKDVDNRFKLSIITDKNTIREEDRKLIDEYSSIDLYDFNLSKKELYKMYADTQILLMPTRMDSFCLVVLEAMKYGCAMVGTNLYALKEMIIDNYNGYVKTPKYQYWNTDNTPNLYVIKNKKKTILSGYIDDDIVNLIVDSLEELEGNREKLRQFCVNSYKMATEKSFSEKSIANQWTRLIEESIES